MSPAIALKHGDSTCARILCVGDDVVHLLDIPRKLDADHDFVIVASREEGESALTVEKPFDLIISGPRMREASAREFREHLREHSPNAEQIILANAGDRGALQMANREARVMRVLQRPCPANQLRDAVYDALLRHRARVLRAEYGHQVTPRSTCIIGIMAATPA